MPDVRILLVDDHALVRETLRELLQREPGFSVVGTAGSAEEAVDLAFALVPDVIVTDVDMPGVVCFDAARRISALHPEIRLIFLSAYTHDHYIEQALQVGALGYLTKGESPDRVVAAIRAAMDNQAYFSGEVRDRIVCDCGQARLAPRGTTRTSMLTPREIEVLRYIAQGLSKKQIAGMMHISVKTVDRHSGNLMAKLDIHDRVELARFAIREGLTEV